MYILKNQYVVDNLSNINITKVTNEADINTLSPTLLSSILRSPIVIPIFKLYLLNEDESIRLDASSDFIGGNLKITYQTGQRRSLNVELININQKWTPKPITGLIWIGSKFRLDLGIVWKDTIYWKRAGVFIVNNPQYKRDGSNQTISFSMCDKFGALDGNIFGRSKLKTVIPAGNNMETAFYSLLTEDKGNGTVYDNKKIIFSNRHKNTEVFYDIEQDYNGNIGDIIKELGESISCDVYYNEYGNLVVKSGIDDYASDVLPVVYRFIEGEREIINASLKENWSVMRNLVTVNGATVNGNQFSATVSDDDLRSPFNISTWGESPEVITDEKIYSDELCMDRAMYEMLQFNRGVETLSLYCGYIPQLDVNQIVLVSYPSLGIDLKQFIIDDIDIQLNSEPTTTISLSNVREARFA